jgi:hypothetical protein
VKKGLSILLLLIFLFNVGGYYLVLWGLIRTSDRAFIQKLDNERYSKAELIELKLPVTLPYPIQQQGLSRIDGKIEHNGEVYKLVKHKLENDTVYIYCIRDQQEKRIVKTLTDYVKLTNELPAASKTSLSFVGKFLKDFESSGTNEILQQGGWSMEITETFEPLKTFTSHTRILSPPPKV